MSREVQPPDITHIRPSKPVLDQERRVAMFSADAAAVVGMPRMATETECRRFHLMRCQLVITALCDNDTDPPRLPVAVFLGVLVSLLCC